MADDQEPRVGAQAQQNEALLSRRVLGVVDQKAVFVRKSRFRLLESDAVTAPVQPIFPLVPLEAERCHAYIVGIT